MASVMTERIKIVSDGTNLGTKIYNFDGKEIPLVQSVTLILDADTQVYTAKLTILFPKLEVEVDAEITEENPKGKIIYQIGEVDPVKILKDKQEGKKDAK
jgi:hypothetical protein